MPQVPDFVRLEAKKQLARLFFYDYCKLKYPKHYTPDKLFLKQLCNEVQAFSEQDTQKFLVVNMPPRHYKSFTASNFVEWKLGKDPARKTMTGSYNELLSTTFARKVRDTIDETPANGVLVYRNIFPDTKVKYGQASASKWALEGSTQDSYLATSPTGTATGFGANDIVIDDIIKNSEEAFNENKLNKDWEWLVNTMLSRLEGGDWKVYVFMTRWATNDLAGRIINAYGDKVKVINFKAVQDDGLMLCDSILSKTDYELKTKEMAREIVEANYNQKPIDIEGRLYKQFEEYDDMPNFISVKNYTDTADKGADYLCSVTYGIHVVDGTEYVYVLDVVHSDAQMEVTEPLVANMLHNNKVQVAKIESNNGGRGFARNIKRKLAEVNNQACVVVDVNQTSNKEARILSSSAWVASRVRMPRGWQTKYASFYTDLMSYLKKGKNKHDDAADVMAGIYEDVANTSDIDWGDSSTAL